MKSAAGTKRQGVGYLASAGRVLRAARTASWCVIGLAALALAGCEHFTATTENANTAASKNATAKTVKPDETVREAQTLLARQGYDPGPADGLLGHRTVQAITEYQKTAGLTVDGKVGPRLIESLKAGKYQKSGVRSPQAAERGPYAGSASALRNPLPLNDIFSADYGDIQPIYNLGDEFVWSSGHVDRVLRVGADNVVWRSTDGTGQTAFRSFDVPPLEWQSGTAEGSSKIDIDPQTVWPLEIGKEIQFEVFVSSRKLDQDEVSEGIETWRCARNADEKIDVPAGRFETFVVTCVRDPVPDGDWRRRVWFYAPAVRHYVRRDSFDSKGRRLRVRLVALRPAWKEWPPAARAGLDWAIQDTLSTGEQGSGVEWGSSGVSTKLTIVPGLEFTATGDLRCRNYALIQTPPMAPRVYPAISCWDPDKEKWLVPGLDESVVPVSAVR